MRRQAGCCQGNQQPACATVSGEGNRGQFAEAWRRRRADTLIEEGSAAVGGETTPEPPWRRRSRPRGGESSGSELSARTP